MKLIRYFFFDEIQIIIFLNKTALYITVEKGYIELVKLLLSRKEIDVNSKTIFNILLIKFHILFNCIFIIKFFITFQIIFFLITLP